MSPRLPCALRSSTRSRTIFSAFSVFALAVIFALPAAAAVTTITGAHDSNPNPPGDGDGFDAFNGTFVVPANPSPGTYSATFNNNNAYGLYAVISSTSVTISGGQFRGNGNFGVGSQAGATVSVFGGDFGNNGTGFPNGSDFFSNSGGFLDIYGQFTGMTLGQTQSLTGHGTFTGTLQNNTTSQTYSYLNQSSSLILHDVAAPEPATAAILGVLGLAAVRRRKN